jgi:alpha-glucosidase (family GH31 glycosyl hydrolase)
MVRTALVLLAVSFLCTTGLFAQPAAYRLSGSTLQAGSARFSFLSASLLRMEYSPSKSFVDAPTAVVENRPRSRVHVTAREEDGWIIATTEKLTLRYRPESGKFTKENLRVSWTAPGGEHSWAPGDSDKHNLGGIAASLDGAAKGKLPAFRPGLLSRSGYFLLDDSGTPLWEKRTEWIAPRKDPDSQDLYILAYGEDYAQALKTYADLCGRIPLIPRYALGTWITDLNYEYNAGDELVEKYRYSDEDVKRLALRFRQERIPLDVLVLDFAWHKLGWKGGYDWSAIFPHPKEFLAWAHSNGLKVSLNDHPGYGSENVLSDDDSRARLIRQKLGIPLPPAPSVMLDLTRDWRFATDPSDSGLALHWSDSAFDDGGWKLFPKAGDWEENGFPKYDGIAWYRKWVEVPQRFQGKSLLLIFGGVDDEYDLYVNGVKAAHHGSPGTSVYSTLTSTDVTRLITCGAKNLIALRVNDWGGYGGISAEPVMLADKLPSGGLRFNLAEKRQAEVFMDVLHHPLGDMGVDFWWIDGGRGSCSMPGLSSQMWTNHVYYTSAEKHAGKRAFVFSRYGGWGSHRYPSLFTGDTYSDWEVLAYEVPFTACGGNVLIPYITHDIGGFLGQKIDFSLYARWVEFGVFSPLTRLHSAFENPRDGNLRMPWVYGSQGVDLVRKYFTLRYSLIPYMYTYSRETFEEALPLVRPLYLEHPALEEAYVHPQEYYFGRELLVAPVVDSTGAQAVYLPPGEWVDYFTEKRYPGNSTVREEYPLDRMPVFVKAGSIIPTQPPREYTGQRSLDTLLLDVYGPGPAAFDLYEDDGVSLGYRRSEFARTPIAFSKKGALTIGPAKGTYRGQPQARAYAIRIHGGGEPAQVSMDRRLLSRSATSGLGWTWDSQRSLVTVRVPMTSVRKAIKLEIQP